MTPFWQLAMALAFSIITAKLGGYLSLRLGQPAVPGVLFVIKYHRTEGKQ